MFFLEISQGGSLWSFPSQKNNSNKAQYSFPGVQGPFAKQCLDFPKNIHIEIGRHDFFGKIPGKKFKKAAKTTVESAGF